MPTKMTSLAKGRDSAKKYLEENPKVMEELTKKIHEKYKIGAANVEEEMEPAQKVSANIMAAANAKIAGSAKDKSKIQ
jgi:hypothetical protein